MHLSSSRKTVAGIRLVPVRQMLSAPSGQSVRGQCVATARKLGFPVPCPTLLPADAFPTDLQGGPYAHVYAREYMHPGLDGARSFAVASIEWSYDSPRVGHLVLIGSPAQTDARRLVYAPVQPRAGDTILVLGKLRLNGHEAEWVQVPASSSFGGLVWTVGQHTYGVGFHGSDAGTRALDLAVASTTILLGP